MNEKKARQKIILLTVTLVVVLISILVLNSDTTYTFFSRASEEEPMQVVTDLSQPVIDVSSEELPECVVSLSYLPEIDDTGVSCFTQFTCALSESVSLQSSCTLQDNLVTCDVALGCTRIDEWISQASSMCGC